MTCPTFFLQYNGPIHQFNILTVYNGLGRLCSFHRGLTVLGLPGKTHSSVPANQRAR